MRAREYWAGISPFSARAFNFFNSFSPFEHDATKMATRANINMIVGNRFIFADFKKTIFIRECLGNIFCVMV